MAPQPLIEYDLATKDFMLIEALLAIQFQELIFKLLFFGVSR